MIYCTWVSGAIYCTRVRGVVYCTRVRGVIYCTWVSCVTVSLRVQLAWVAGLVVNKSQHLAGFDGTVWVEALVFIRDFIVRRFVVRVHLAAPLWRAAGAIGHAIGHAMGWGWGGRRGGIIGRQR